MNRSVAQLTIHPAVRDAWELPDDDIRFLELIEDIRAHGILEPLRITAAGEVVDGRHRLRAAKVLKWDDVPCELVRSGLNAAGIAISSLAARRHLSSKGQLAYAAYPLLQQRHAGIRAAHTQGLQRGHSPGNGPEETLEDIVGKLGIGRELFKQAGRLHELFAKDEALRAEWEPRIMAGDGAIGLGAALAGIAGQRTCTDRTPQRNSHLARFVTAWSHVSKPAEAWERWSGEERETASTAMRTAIETLPDPLLDVVRDALRATRRARSGTEG